MAAFKRSIPSHAFSRHVCMFMRVYPAPLWCRACDCVGPVLNLCRMRCGKSTWCLLSARAYVKSCSCAMSSIWCCTSLPCNISIEAACRHAFVLMNEMLDVLDSAVSKQHSPECPMCNHLWQVCHWLSYAIWHAVAMTELRAPLDQFFFHGL